jgi:REP element-mobilizing transposase RayT
MNEEYKHLNHSTWDCKYHIVFIPKYRKNALYGQITLIYKRVGRGDFTLSRSQNRA